MISSDGRLHQITFLPWHQMVGWPTIWFPMSLPYGSDTHTTIWKLSSQSRAETCPILTVYALRARCNLINHHQGCDVSKMCIGPNQKNQPNLYLNLVRRYKIFHFSIVVSYLCLCIGQNPKNQPNLVLYLVRRSKTFVSGATSTTTAYAKLE